MDNEHCFFVMKDKMINVEEVSAVIGLMAGERCHIDSGKKEILTAIARQ